MNYSSYDLVRALKATSDPLAAGGPTKIQIARQAWDDASFYVPNKDEVIMDWILTKFLKERSRDSSLNPVVDLRFWSLVYDIISSSDAGAAAANSRPLKTWLAALLIRIPIAPIILSLLDLFADLDSEMRKQLSLVVSSCLAIIWPFAVQKLSIEVLLDSLNAFLRIFRLCESDEGLVRIGLLITSSYKKSLWNSPNKKKVHLIFLQTHFSRWLECAVIKLPPDSHKALLQYIYDAGIETLFNSDVLRQARDSEPDNMFFEAIARASSSNPLILSGLPRIFASFLQIIEKYRSPLFRHGPNQPPGAITDELHATGMRFFASCQQLLDDVESRLQTWPTRVALLSLVDEENLFNSRQKDFEPVLNRSVDSALTVLRMSWDVDQTDITRHAAETLSALARIDYDLILPVLPHILPQILLARECSQPFSVFLDLLLSYHTKTRTMNAYIASLFSALSPHYMVMVPSGCREAYEIAHSGPLMDVAHLARLSKSIQTFLTSTQVLSTALSVLGTLKDLWKQFYDAVGHPDASLAEDTRKKSKTVMAGDSDGSGQANTLAVAFSLSAKLASVVLSSLPMQTVPESTQHEIYQLLNDTWSSSLHRVLRKTLKIIQKSSHNGSWAPQIVAAASLRLQYALEISQHVSLCQSDDLTLYLTMTDTSKDGGPLPELNLEIFRALLSRTASQEQTEAQGVFDHFVTYLDANFRESGAYWSGHPHRLDTGKKGKAESALALMHMVLERWLPVVESLASPPQLEKLMRIIMSVKSNIPTDPLSVLGLQAHSLLIQTLHSASFWELPNMRTVCLEYLNEAISSIDGDARDYSFSRISDTIAAYRILLYCPVEYFSRPYRANFIKRASAADKLISCLPIDSVYTLKHKYQALATLRVFLQRVCSHTGFLEQSIQTTCDFLEHLLTVEDFPSQLDEDYISATVTLIELHFSELFKVSDEAGARAIPDILRCVSKLGPGLSSSDHTHELDVHFRSIIRMIETLTTEFSFTTFPQEAQFSMKELYHHLSASVLSRLSDLTSVHSTGDIDNQSNVMSMWCRLLSFGRWLSVTNNSLPPIGKRLASQVVLTQPTIIKPDAWDKIRTTTLAILLQELHYCAENDRSAHLDLIVAVYIFLSRTINVDGRRKMDHQLSMASKMLPVSDFSHVLAFISDSLAIPAHSPEELTHLIQLSVVLLGDHPPSTLKQMQSFTTQCINLFAGRRIFTNGPVELRLQVVEFVARHCCDHPAALRLVDLGSIWSLLTKFLSGSPAHDEETTADIFHKIAIIISALVRLRRDMVMLALPHLGLVLRLMMLSVRRVRPDLGAKQTMLVTDTQPRWINAKHPLGAEEGKILARLLETLTTKSIVRSNVSSNTHQKAESLAKPFSKHAAYVLKAYIEATNFPLCILPSELRKELQPGLYALCSMINDHSRDAMMVSALDPGGKATMKKLWKEYEKQRYIGKG